MCRRMCWFFGYVMFFCNNFAMWLQKTVATSDAMCRRMCWFFGYVMFFCNNFARWLQNTVAASDAMCKRMCWFFGDVMFFCNNFARWLQRYLPFDAISRVWATFISRLMPSPWLGQDGIKPDVGNSPLFLDESSDHGLGQRYEDILMPSPRRYCSENSPTFQTT